MTFQSTKFHRIIPGFMAQGGDAGDSIFGGTFEDESFRLRHTKVGRLSMANYGPATNKAQPTVPKTIRWGRECPGPNITGGGHNLQYM